MGDDQQGPYSPADRKRALVWSALLGWAGVTARELREAEWWQILGALPFAAVIGLPVAFMFTWLVGGPILRHVMRHPVSWLQAAAWGVLIATLIAAISILIQRLNGYRISRDPTFDFWTAREVDGILTPLGWRWLAIDTVVFIMLGAMVGLVVRRLIGPGNAKPE